jgi:hypothetical protein
MLMLRICNVNVSTNNSDDDDDDEKQDSSSTSSSDDSDDGPAEPAVIIGMLEKSDKNKDKSYSDNKDPGKTNQR